MGEVFVGDVGTEIVLECGVDISNATVMKIHARLPNDKTVVWTAAIDGTTRVKYLTQTGDISETGTWKLQAYVEMPGWKGFGAITKMTVSDPI